MRIQNICSRPDRVGLVTETSGESCRFLQEQGAGVYAEGDVRIRIGEKEEGLSVLLRAVETPVCRVVLSWERAAGEGLCLGDHWERGYGDLAWEKPAQGRVMPWYFAQEEENGICAWGVKVRPAAMCWWEIREGAVRLHLDVRCGTGGVLLAGRELETALVLRSRYEQGTAFEALRHFCGRMCTDSLYDGTPIYGSNNWYYAYGVSSREEILKDSAYLAAMTEGIPNRPFMVIDDGWQSHHTDRYNGGPWDAGNRDYGDMGDLAAGMKALGVRPGIWFRPLLDTESRIPAEWRLERDPAVLDISVPEVLERVREDLRRIRGWGFELVKHDFSTFDLFGCWGFQMGERLTGGNWRFRDPSRTTAEWILRFYEAVREAAGDMLILGCNCVGHLGAGLIHANRTGDDTSGKEWERTKKMGVNTLAFRMPQHGAFFGADADCVGITASIDWEKNRQWMEMLSESGTPFFVSVRPGFLNESQQEELKAAYRKAAANRKAAEPLDWKETKTPERWQTAWGERRFCW